MSELLCYHHFKMRLNYSIYYWYVAMNSPLKRNRHHNMVQNFFSTIFPLIFQKITLFLFLEFVNNTQCNEAWSRINLGLPDLFSMMIDFRLRIVVLVFKLLLFTHSPTDIATSFIICFVNNFNKYSIVIYSIENGYLS